MLGHGSAELRVYKVGSIRDEPGEILKLRCRKLPEPLDNKCQVSYDIASLYMRFVSQSNKQPCPRR